MEYSRQQRPTIELGTCAYHPFTDLYPENPTASIIMLSDSSTHCNLDRLQKLQLGHEFIERIAYESYGDGQDCSR